MKTKSLSILVSIGIAVSALLVGCARETKSGATSGAKSASASNQNVANTNTAAPKVVKAVFRVDENSRDPFFPQAKKSTAVAASVPKAAVGADIPELLRSGFQGIGLSGESRIAIINNVILEPGKLVSVPVEGGKREQSVSVRCREINRTSVILDVEGVPEPVVISRQEKNQFEARR